jgi:hypothetical protein
MSKLEIAKLALLVSRFEASELELMRKNATAAAALLRAIAHEARLLCCVSWPTASGQPENGRRSPALPGVRISRAVLRS